MLLFTQKCSVFPLGPSTDPCYLAGNQWQTAVKIFQAMPEMGLSADVITCSSVISALAKGKQHKLAMEVVTPIT